MSGRRVRNVGGFSQPSCDAAECEEVRDQGGGHGRREGSRRGPQASRGGGAGGAREASHRHPERRTAGGPAARIARRHGAGGYRGPEHFAASGKVAAARNRVPAEPGPPCPSAARHEPNRVSGRTAPRRDRLQAMTRAARQARRWPAASWDEHPLEPHQRPRGVREGILQQRLRRRSRQGRAADGRPSLNRKRCASQRISW